MACRWGPHHANPNATHDAHPPPCCPSITVILVTTLFLPLFLELFDCCAVLSTSVIVVAASAPIEVRGILCIELLHESQNAPPDVHDEYPSLFNASCAVMLAPISSSREGEQDGVHFQANTSTSSSSSSSQRTYSRCAPRAASTIRARRLHPPRRISRTRRSHGSRLCVRGNLCSPRSKSLSLNIEYIFSVRPSVRPSIRPSIRVSVCPCVPLQISVGCVC